MANHELAVGMIMAMVMIDMLRGGGIGMMAIIKVIHEW